jgi:hypothetical protein
MERQEVNGTSRPVNRADVWPSYGRCRLCSTEGPLCRSHIIPKFVGDWLKATGITGRLRGSDRPNRLVEDLPWRHLLCKECEARFSRSETAVFESVFLPLHEERETRFRYGPWFARFAVSVAWRALVKLQTEGSLRTPIAG